MQLCDCMFRNWGTIILTYCMYVCMLLYYCMYVIVLQWLQGASEHMASLQHSLAMLQATNSSQQDVLYTTQMHNER